MIFDAIVAVIILKIFEVEGLKALAAFCMVAVIRTCHNVNWFCGTMEQQMITLEEEEGEDN